MSLYNVRKELQDIKKGIPNYPHRKIHESRSFICTTGNATMGNGDEINMAFKTGTGAYQVHMVADFVTKAGAQFQILEGATWAAQIGVSSQVYNRNRFESGIQSTIQEASGQATFAASNVAQAGVNITGGTAIEDEYTWGANPVFEGSKRQRGQAEFILSTGQTYAFKLTAIGDTNAGQIVLNWYEA